MVMSNVINIRIENGLKEELKQIAKFKNETVSSIVNKLIIEMVEDEFDYKIAREAISNRKIKESNEPIETLYKEYGI